MRWPIEMPWEAARRRFETLLDQFAIANGRLAELAAIVARPMPRAPEPVVSVLVIADGPEGRITMGESGPIDDLTTLILPTYVDLKDASIVVFADLARVKVVRIQLGNMLLTAAHGPCPMAFVKTWMTGIDLFVDCEAR